MQIVSELWFPWQQIPPIGFNGGKQCHRVFSTIFDQSLFILVGNDDIHKSLNVFKIRSDRTMNYRVSCPLASEKT